MKSAMARSGVERWAAAYTRGLPAAVSAERREELAADIQDQIEWATSQGTPDEAVARSIVLRAIAGAPSDLTWRFSQRWLMLIEARDFARLLVPAGSVVAALLIVLGAVAASRGAHLGPQFWTAWINVRGVVPVTVATAGAVCGLIMLNREPTRLLGALWLIAATQVVILQGLPLLAGTSTVLRWATETEPGTFTIIATIDLGLTLDYLALAVASGPAKARA